MYCADVVYTRLYLTVYNFLFSYVHANAKESYTIQYDVFNWKLYWILKTTQFLHTINSFTQQIRCNQLNGNHSCSGNNKSALFLHRISTLLMVSISSFLRCISQYPVICLISECFHALFIFWSQIVIELICKKILNTVLYTNISTVTQSIVCPN